MSGQVVYYTLCTPMHHERSDEIDLDHSERLLICAARIVKGKLRREGRLYFEGLEGGIFEQFYLLCLGHIHS